MFMSQFNKSNENLSKSGGNLRKEKYIEGKMFKIRILSIIGGHVYYIPFF